MGEFVNAVDYSHSLGELARECLRKLYLRKIQSWRGWFTDAPSPKRLAYVLSKQGSVWTYAGKVVHELGLRALLSRVTDEAGQRELLELADTRMRQARGASRSGRWRDDPKRVPSFFEDYYRHPDADRLFELARQRVADCLAELFRTARLFDLARGDVLETEALEKVGLTDDVAAYVKADLAVDDGKAVHLVDLKIGKPSDSHADQVRLYAWSLYRRGVWHDGGKPIRGRLFYLKTGTERAVVVNEEACRAVAKQAVQQIRELRLLLRGDGRVWLGHPADFPRTTDESTCQRCAFYHACYGSREIPGLGSLSGFEPGQRVELERKRRRLAAGRVVAYRDEPDDCAFSFSGDERLVVELDQVDDDRLPVRVPLRLNRSYRKADEIGPARPGGWTFHAKRLARGEFRRQGGKYRPVVRPVGSVNVAVVS